jgi:hypothetical protein
MLYPTHITLAQILDRPSNIKKGETIDVDDADLEDVGV